MCCSLPHPAQNSPSSRLRQDYTHTKGSLCLHRRSRNCQWWRRCHAGPDSCSWHTDKDSRTVQSPRHSLYTESTCLTLVLLLQTTVCTRVIMSSVAGTQSKACYSDDCRHRASHHYVPSPPGFHPDRCGQLNCGAHLWAVRRRQPACWTRELRKLWPAQMLCDRVC
jgi:hypothetical protein